MSLQFVIDGYNVINHPQFHLKGRQFDHPQPALLAFIKSKNLTGSRRNQIMLVFDGFPPAGVLLDGREVIFSRKISADEKIKRIVEESANRKNIIVVSDDKEIKFTTRSLGAKWLAVDEFIGPKEKSQAMVKKEAPKQALNYSQIDAINKELAKLWLKKQD
jgi:predicted RNA-binding protein with PIN domain